ncbi:Small GTPase superfamily [Cynara cardunculus var. scolymus]|uniref:Small GTPase superfamily n=1 Tax=Cynara cardunculus var. scolymus TaxID=59895 RepID=A0A124SI83_CYNCS|nr:Small GTPase superfamily [Cynara cardunculus var. scolymus]
MATKVDHDYGYLLKIVLIGDFNVGKTNILSRFTRNEFFLESKPPLALNLLQEVSRLKFGTLQGRRDTDAYYRGAVGALLVYGITKRPTFDHVQIWVLQLRYHADYNIVVMMTGNKSDLSHLRVVVEEDASLWLKKKGFRFLKHQHSNHITSRKHFKLFIISLARKHWQQKNHGKETTITVDNTSRILASPAPGDGALLQKSELGDLDVPSASVNYGGYYNLDMEHKKMVTVVRPLN